MTQSPPRLTHDQAAALSEAILGVEGIDSFHAGRFGQIALIYSGDRFPGLWHPSPTDDEPRGLEIHVVVTREGLKNLKGIADQIRTLAADYFAGSIDVIIADAAV